MTMVDRCLILFTRFPHPGTTKTRLIPALGAGGAAELQKCLTEHMVQVAGNLRRVEKVQVSIFGSGADPEAFRRWLGPDFHYGSQREGGLGERLVTALKQTFAEGYQRVIVAGIDCPFITVDHLQQGFQALTDHDGVIGPALDGGYYLIGMKQLNPAYFLDIDWGTEWVYAQTTAKIQTSGDRFFTLPLLADIDYPEDLALLKNNFPDWLNVHS